MKLELYVFKNTPYFTITMKLELYVFKNTPYFTITMKLELYVFKNTPYFTITFAFIVKMSRDRDGDMKENYRDSGGHISFHNPNYSCNTGGSAVPIEGRTNRFQGIFKYDKNQVTPGMKIFT